jgi:hypothetical protein
VIHLPRHLREIHSWPAEKAKSALSAFGLRKRYVRKNPVAPPKHKDYHRYRRCPFEGCIARIKRLSTHLGQVHKICRRSPLYNDVIAKAECMSYDKDCDDDAIDFDEDDVRFHVEVNDGDVNVDNADVNVDNANADVEVDNADADDDVNVDDVDDVDDVNDDDDDVAVNADDNVGCDHFERSLPVDKFESWLKSPDGGLKGEKAAKQHAAQLKVVMVCVGEHDKSLMWDKNLLQKFLHDDVPAKNLSPGTVKSYLQSLRHFYTFVTTEYKANLSPTVVQDIYNMNSTIGRWIASLRKDCSKMGLQKMDADVQKLITPNDINKFEQSVPARMAIKFLGGLNNSGLVLSQTEYVTVRDFILT